MSPDADRGGPTCGPAPSLPGRSIDWRTLASMGGRFLFLAGFVALATCALLILGKGLYQSFESRRLDWLLAHNLEAGPASTGTDSEKLPEGSLIGRIEIPRLGLSSILAEGSNALTLLVAVGHIRGTSLPGEGGNVAVSGHRDSFFRGLGRVREGDAVRIVTQGGAYTYRVESTLILSPERTEVLRATEVPTLTLITCYPFGYIGPAPKRFIVRARQVSPAPPSLAESPGEPAGHAIAGRGLSG